MMELEDNISTSNDMTWLKTCEIRGIGSANVLPHTVLNFNILNVTICDNGQHGAVPLACTKKSYKKCMFMGK